MMTKLSPTATFHAEPDTPSGQPAEDSLHGSSAPGYLLEDLDDGVVVLQSGRAVFTNHRMEVLTGYSGSDLRSRLPEALALSSDRSRLVADLTAVSEGASRRRCTVRHRRKDGLIVPFELRITPTTWQDEAAILVLVTELVDRQQQSQRDALLVQLHDAVFQHTPIPLLLVELPALTILACNPAAAALRGKSTDEMCGMSIEDFHGQRTYFRPDGSRLEHEDYPLVRALRTGEPVRNAQIESVGEGGETRHVMVSVDLIQEDGEAPRAAVLRIQDIGEVQSLRERSRLLLDEANMLRGQLEQADEERERLQQSMQELRQNQAELLDYGPLGYLLVDGKGTVRECNTTALALIARKRDHVVGHPLLSVAAQRHRAVLADHLQTVMTSSSPNSCEIELISDSPHRRFVRLESVAEAGARDGVQIRVALIDITKRMRAEIKLAQNEQRYRSIVESPLTIVIVIDAEYKLRFVSQGFCNLLGYPYRDLIGADFRPLVAEHQREAISERYRLRRAGEQVPAQYEIQLIARDGTPRWIIANISLASRDDGGVNTVVMAVDVTDREKATAGLRQQEELLNRLFAQSADAVYLRRGNRFVMVNPQFERLFGYSSEELLDPDFDAYTLIPEDERATFRKRMREAAVSEQKSALYNFNGTRKDGQRLELQGSSSLVTWNDQPALLGVVRNLTNERRLERQMAQMQRLESIGRLTGGIAHDFNNLLAGIVGQGERIRMRFDPSDPVHQEMLTLLDTAHSAGELTRRLLNFSRVRQSAPKPIDLNGHLLRLERMLLRIIGDDVQLQVEPAEAMPPVVADPTQVEQVIVNLCVNAKDAMPEGGTLTIQTGLVELEETMLAEGDGIQPGPYARVSVSDEGVGMTPEVMAHIFEPFYTTKEEGRGTGLGLATVFGVVRQNHGTIRVTSQPGAGSRFDVYLPVAPESASVSAD